MSKRRKQRRRGKSPSHVGDDRCATIGTVEEARPVDAAGTLSGEESAEIGRYISQNKARAAVKQAKKLHSRVGSSQSESLLVKAYAARIEEMRRGGLDVEARELRALVARRFPSAWERHNRRQAPASAPADGLADLVRPLGDDDLPPGRRAEIEDVIRREVTDLSALADCSALPAEHALRRGAAALAKAMSATTTGPVSDAEIALHEVPRRGPLAAWKLLARAIACFHRRDDEGCLRYLSAMDSRAAAARLAPAMRAMLGQGGGEQLPEASAALARRVTGPEDGPLREALAKLDALFSRDVPGNITHAVGRAVDACRTARPDLLDRLKQHISIRSVLVDIPADRVIKALKGPALHDANFWRLFARAEEVAGDPAYACALWAEFLPHAVNEGWFAAAGPEVAAVYRHMAEQLLRLSERELPRAQYFFDGQFEGLGPYYHKQPPAIRALAPKRGDREAYFIYPERLYKRGCAIDPRIHADWLSYTKARSGDSRLADDVAERWHAASPDDIRPLLHLAESAENRKTFTKALKYINRAESLDALNPSVKRARLRLWVLKSLAHLKQGKAHLLAKDLDEIESMAQSHDGDRPAFMAAMRWLGADLAGDAPALAAQREQVDDLMGGALGGAVMINCVRSRLSKQNATYKFGWRGHDAPPLPNAGSLPRAVARACAAGDSLAVQLKYPYYWAANILSQMPNLPSDIPPSHLHALGQAACRCADGELAFRVAGLGLGLGAEHEPRFLLLRAMSMPYHASARCEEALVVAAELARRRRDMDLVAEIVDAHRAKGARVGIMDGPEDLWVDDEGIAAVLERERTATDFPTRSYEDVMRRNLPADSRALPRGSKGAKSLPMGPLFGDVFDDEDDDEFDDEDDFDDEFDDDLGVDLHNTGGMMGIPLDVIEVLAALRNEIGDRAPRDGDIARLFRKRPDLLEGFLNTMPGMPLPPGFFSGPGPRSTKNVNRKDRRRKRKRDRKKRGH